VSKVLQTATANTGEASCHSLSWCDRTLQEEYDRLSNEEIECKHAWMQKEHTVGQTSQAKVLSFFAKVPKLQGWHDFPSSCPK
jgi:hypothetical protein